MHNSRRFSTSNRYSSLLEEETRFLEKLKLDEPKYKKTDKGEQVKFGGLSSSTSSEAFNLINNVNVNLGAQVNLLGNIYKYDDGAHFTPLGPLKGRPSETLTKDMDDALEDQFQLMWEKKFKELSLDEWRDQKSRVHDYTHKPQDGEDVHLNPSPLFELKNKKDIEPMKVLVEDDSDKKDLKSVIRQTNVPEIEIRFNDTKGRRGRNYYDRCAYGESRRGYNSKNKRGRRRYNYEGFELDNYVRAPREKAPCLTDETSFPSLK